MPSTTPLTDAINALTQYANETTGASDTTLSDAVGTLVAGYGGGGGGDFETGVIVGDGTVHSSYITIPVSKLYSHFAILIDDITGHANGDFYGCWGTSSIFISAMATATGVNGQIAQDTRGVYLKFTATDIKFQPAVNGGFRKMILNANYRWIAWN